jgi:hypothetical protein
MDPHFDSKISVQAEILATDSRKEPTLWSANTNWEISGVTKCMVKHASLKMYIDRCRTPKILRLNCQYEQGSGVGVVFLSRGGAN